MSNSKQNDWVSLIINRFEEQVSVYDIYVMFLFLSLQRKQLGRVPISAFTGGRLPGYIMELTILYVINGTLNFLATVSMWSSNLPRKNQRRTYTSMAGKNKQIQIFVDLPRSHQDTNSSQRIGQ